MTKKPTKTMEQAVAEVMQKYFPNRGYRKNFALLLAMNNDNMNAVRELMQCAKNYPQESGEMIHMLDDSAFLWSIEKDRLDIYHLLIELTPDKTQRQKMLRSHSDAAFKKAVEMGRSDIIKRLVDFIEPDAEIQKMIHAKDDEAFVFAAQKGSLDVINCLIELTPEAQRQKMIHAQKDRALLLAAQKGHFAVINLLIELTPEMQKQELIFKALLVTAQNGHSNAAKHIIELIPETERQKVIFKAFSVAARDGYLNAINYMVELTPEAQRQQMIHAQNDQAFLLAVQKGNLNSANHLIELTPEAQRQQMIDKVTNPTPDFTRFLNIIYNQPHDPNDTKTTTLKELHDELIRRFKGDDATKKANAVIATLLSKDNLQKSWEHFTCIPSIYFTEEREEQSNNSSATLLPPPPPALPRLPEELWRNAFLYNSPVDFPTLSPEDRETALLALAYICDKPEVLESTDRLRETATNAVSRAAAEALQKGPNTQTRTT